MITSIVLIKSQRQARHKYPTEENYKRILYSFPRLEIDIIDEYGKNEPERKLPILLEEVWGKRRACNYESIFIAKLEKEKKLKNQKYAIGTFDFRFTYENEKSKTPNRKKNYTLIKMLAANDWFCKLVPQKFFLIFWLYTMINVVSTDWLNALNLLLCSR